MGSYLLQDFVENTGGIAPGQGDFELERGHLLRVNLRGVVWTRMGSMVAHRGSTRFVNLQMRFENQNGLHGST